MIDAIDISSLNETKYIDKNDAKLETLNNIKKINIFL